jgi:tRNA 2-thiouridine synthesizing protein A
MSAAPRLVDARGLLCPWPVIRLARAAREIGGTGAVRILADDPAAPREIEQLCRERGWLISPDPLDATAFDVLIR